ncbi:MAG: PilZ domain-containing protein [Candidatus Korobacteraceae bacterium]
MSESQAVEAGIERRLVPRTLANGEVVLRPYDRTLLQGQMVDIGAGGFRMRYVGKRMRVGSEVEVVHPWNNLRALVAWTIRSGDWIHAGFKLIPYPSIDSPVEEDA